MARISTYPFDTTVNDNDAWIGTESQNRLTKQFTASAVANYLNINAKVNIGGQMSFKWSDTQNGGIGTVSKTGGGGSGAARRHCIADCQDERAEDHAGAGSGLGQAFGSGI